MIKYIRLSLEEREKIYLLKQNKCSIRRIAKHVGRGAMNKSCVWRETEVESF